MISKLILLLVQLFMLNSNAFSITRSMKHKFSLRSSMKMVADTDADFALLFDCDGVIVETEELHRLAYNKAFKHYGLKLPDGKPVEWTVDYYDVLQNTVGGGKPKMKHYFNNDAKVWPTSTAAYLYGLAPKTIEAKNELVDKLQDAKTYFYKEIIEEIAVARPGVLELIDAAIADPKLKVGICSAATKGGFVKLVNAIVGQDRLNKLDIVIAGDDVSAKKPDPMIYNTARERIGLPAEKCIVIEDSIVGLKAAKGASMRCLITYTPNTAGEDFYGLGADAKVADLSDVSLDDIIGPFRAGKTELLETKRDKKEVEGKKSSKKSKNVKTEMIKEEEKTPKKSEKKNPEPKKEEPKKPENDGWTPSDIVKGVSELTMA